jgi:hypothetical protein
VEETVRYRGIPALIALLFALSGCAAVRSAVSARFTGGEEVRVEPMPPLDEQLYRSRLFYAEYLQETGETTQRVAVLAEELPAPLRLLLNPARFVSGETGAERLPVLARRLAPMRLYAVVGPDGRRLGYAFLPPGRMLRPLRFSRGVHTFDLSLE